MKLSELNLEEVQIVAVSTSPRAIQSFTIDGETIPYKDLKELLVKNELFLSTSDGRHFQAEELPFYFQTAKIEVMDESFVAVNNCDVLTYDELLFAADLYGYTLKFYSTGQIIPKLFVVDPQEELEAA